MDSLDGTEWDVVISGTGLPQSLLALALSRSGKKILHLDRNDYYGGNEAALSLSEAEAFADKHAAEDTGSALCHASIVKPAESDERADEQKLGYSRAYSLALAPQLIYTRSNLLPALVSSRTHSQLDFQAVGSWFITGDSQQLTRVPSSREDIFQDDTLNLKAKRSLVKFIRFVAAYEEQSETWQNEKSSPFPEFLERRFGLPFASHAPLLALTLTDESSGATTVEFALPRIARHLRSIGLFGPGFGALLPKWGGLAEVTQVACRACAVGGGVYVLKKDITTSSSGDNDTGRIPLELSDDEKVSTTWLAGCQNELQPIQSTSADEDKTTVVSKSISIVSSASSMLFLPTSEGGVTPAGAVVVVPSPEAHEPPVYILAHSSDSGECPQGQCVLYASVAQPHKYGFERLERAVEALLRSTKSQADAKVLWSMQYEKRLSAAQQPSTKGDMTIVLPQLSTDLAFEDSILESVKLAWQKITGDGDDEFMRFEARQGADDEE